MKLREWVSWNGNTPEVHLQGNRKEVSRRMDKLFEEGYKIIPGSGVVMNTNSAITLYKAKGSVDNLSRTNEKD